MLDSYKDKLSQSGIALTYAKQLGILLSDFDTLISGPICTGTGKLALPAVTACNGFVIPYFDSEGRFIDHFRFRFLDAGGRGFAKAFKQTKRYLQRPKSPHHAYMPPINGRAWSKIQKDVAVPLIITEGELKTLSGNLLTEWAVLGLGGVDCYRAKRQGLALLPDLEAFVWRDRQVYICYDSDAATNPDVQRAECDLAKTLIARGASVYVVRLPPTEDSKKNGLDDYLVNYGADAFNDIISTTEPWVQNSVLAEMNTRFAMLEDPVCVVELKNFRMMKISEFKDLYSNIVIEEVTTYTDKKGEEKTRVTSRPGPEVWMRWPGRLTLAGLTYAPGLPRIVDSDTLLANDYLARIPGRYVNKYTQRFVEPKKGDVGPFLRLVDSLMGNEKEFRDYFMKWVAYPIQHPGAKMYSAIVLWGTGQGTGKTLLGKIIAAMYEDNAKTVAIDKLFKEFNSWASGTQFVKVDEAAAAADVDRWHASEKLKNLISEDEVCINEKYRPEVRFRNTINYYFTSNKSNCVVVEPKDRRFGVHEVPTTELPQSEVRRILDWMSDGGIAALLDYMLTYDLEDFTPNTRPPLTLSKMEMIESSRSALETWVARLLESPDDIFGGDAIYGRCSMLTSEELVSIYDPEKRTNVHEAAMATVLKNAGVRRVYNGMPLRVPGAASGRRLWAVRDVEELATMDGPSLIKRYSEERGVSASKVAKFRRGG